MNAENYKIYTKAEKSFAETRKVLNIVTNEFNTHYNALIDKKNHDNTEFLVKCLVVSEIFRKVNEAGCMSMLRENIDKCKDMNDVMVNIIRSVTEVCAPGDKNE